MKDMKRVLEEYGRGDFDTRLHLFLKCRALRKAFMTIEQEEAPAEVPATEESGRAGQGTSTPFSLPRDDTYGPHLERPLPEQEIP